MRRRLSPRFGSAELDAVTLRSNPQPSYRVRSTSPRQAVAVAESLPTIPRQAVTGHGSHRTCAHPARQSGCEDGAADRKEDAETLTRKCQVDSRRGDGKERDGDDDALRERADGGHGSLGGRNRSVSLRLSWRAGKVPRGGQSKRASDNALRIGPGRRESHESHQVSRP